MSNFVIKIVLIFLNNTFPPKSKCQIFWSYVKSDELKASITKILKLHFESDSPLANCPAVIFLFLTLVFVMKYNDQNEQNKSAEKGN